MEDKKVIAKKNITGFPEGNAAVSPHNVLQSPDYECCVAHWDKPRKQKKKKKNIHYK